MLLMTNCNAKMIHSGYLCQVLIEEQKIGLLMKHTVRPPVTSNNLGEQTYILRLTSYGNLSICAKNNIHIYCFKFFTSIDLW